MPKRIAAFGEVMMRLQVPGYETLAQGDTLQYSFSGTGVNVVSALARYGHTGELVTRFPDNPLGDAAKAYLHKLGIDTARIVRGGKYVGMYFLENGYAKAKPYYEELLRLADIVMMNEKDAMLTLGMSTAKQEREEQLAELIPAVAADYGISAIAGTHRSIHGDNSHSLRGFLHKGGRLVFSDLLTFSVYDRIGAGDAFASGIIHGELEGFAPEQTVRFAAVAGMLAHTVPGDTPLATEAEILRAMEQSFAGDVER